MSNVPKSLKLHSRALLKWAVERKCFTGSNKKPDEWSVEWDMSVVNGLCRRGYLCRDGVFYRPTQLGIEIAAQYEMPRNERYWAEQKRWAEEDLADESTPSQCLIRSQSCGDKEQM